MLKIQQIFPKFSEAFFKFFFFHNLESQIAGFVDIKKDLIEKRSKGNFVLENLKNKHRY